MNTSIFRIYAVHILASGLPILTVKQLENSEFILKNNQEQIFYF